MLPASHCVLAGRGGPNTDHSRLARRGPSAAPRRGVRRRVWGWASSALGTSGGATRGASTRDGCRTTAAARAAPPEAW